MCVSTASSERCFSAFGFVHSKLRNLLGEDQVKKLVYVRSNFIELDKNNEKKYDNDEEEISDDCQYEER